LIAERFTPEDFFRHTKPAGVDRISLIQMRFHGSDNPDRPAIVV
jgi:hypothetical protein